MRKVKMPVVASLLAIMSITSAAWAVPQVIPYQGRLTDAAGTPLNGSYSIRFSIWSALTGGVELWNETQATVTVASGLFSVNLGSVTAIPTSVFSGSDLYLEIKVGSDAAMTPRQRLGTVPYSMRTGVGPGVSNQFTGVVGGLTGTQDLETCTVTFPAAGYALVIGSAWLEMFHVGGQTGNYRISVNDVSATEDFGSLAYMSLFSMPTGFTWDVSLTTNRVFTVAAGTKTFYLVGSQRAADGVNLGTGRLVVQYFPDAIGPTQAAPFVVEKSTPAGSSQGNTTGDSRK